MTVSVAKMTLIRVDELKIAKRGVARKEKNDLAQWVSEIWILMKITQRFCDDILTFTFEYFGKKKFHIAMFGNI